MTSNTFDPSRRRLFRQGAVIASGAAPPAGVFGTADPEGTEMTIADNNTNPNGVNSAGTWIYQIWATLNGQQYSTIASIPNPRNVSNNPTIQNK